MSCFENKFSMISQNVRNLKCSHLFKVRFIFKNIKRHGKELFTGGSVFFESLIYYKNKAV